MPLGEGDGLLIENQCLACRWFHAKLERRRDEILLRNVYANACQDGQ